MNWIFNNISKASQTKRDNNLYLDFEDFKLSFCYLSIFSNLNKSIFKLNPKNRLTWEEYFNHQFFK